MRLRMTMRLTIMLAMALERTQTGHPEHLRSLVQTRLTGDHPSATKSNPIPQSAPRDRSVLGCPSSHR